MSKWTWIFVFAFFAAFVLCCGGVALMVAPSMKIAASGQEFAETTLKAVAQSWSVDELAERAGEGYRGAFDRQLIELEFERNRRELGRLVRARAKLGSFEPEVETAQGRATRVVYDGQADFDKGPGQVRLTLLYRGNDWSLESFSVKPSGK